MPKMQFKRDKHARTDALKKEWVAILYRLFPDIIGDPWIGDYGFSICLPHPDPNVKQFKLIYRYNGLPEDTVERDSILEYLRDEGESLPIHATTRYEHGRVTTYNT